MIFGAKELLAQIQVTATNSDETRQSLEADLWKQAGDAVMAALTEKHGLVKEIPL